MNHFFCTHFFNYPKQKYSKILKNCFLTKTMLFLTLVLSTFSSSNATVTSSEIFVENLKKGIYSDLQLGNADLIDLSIAGEEVTFVGRTSQANGGLFLNRDSKIKFSSAELIFTKSSATKSGGAIYNSGTITFGEETEFLKNSITASSNSFFQGGAIFNDSNITFDNKASFSDNFVSASMSSQAYGGAIYNTGKITLKGSSSFTNNTASTTNGYAHGGAIYNKGNIEFKTGTLFTNNLAVGYDAHGYALGGAILNDSGNITFDETVTFASNKATGNGYYIEGGAIYNHTNSTIKFNDESLFLNNTTVGVDYASGGAITNASIITFNDGFLFSENKVFGTDAKGADIYNTGNITFAGAENTIGALDGGIYQDSGIINKTGTGTLILGDNMKNAHYGSTFIQTAGLTIAHTDKLNFAATNTITGGELKTHGGKINHSVTVGQVLGDDGSVISTGSAVHYTNLEEMEINKETIGAVQYAGEDLGATIGFGSYTKAEKDAEIALMKGKVVSYTDTKGTLDTSDDEVVTYLASDKLFTTDTLEEGKVTHFKVTEALDNEKGNIIAFRNASVEIDSRIGNTGATYELEHSVLESSSVANKVIANNMKVGGNNRDISFGELEIKAGTILDIDNKHVTANKVTFGEESILSVTLNHLQDHGTLSHEEVAGDEGAKLVLKLTEGLTQEAGIYQIFNEDNNLALEKNGLIDVIDMQDGSYKVAKKSVETLSKELGTTKEEATIANALLSGNSKKEEFVQVQTEILGALQSQDKGTVTKAKKALTALSARNTAVHQSQLTTLFTQMYSVISQMLMRTTSDIWGHNGGEEPARATVYVKGFYDRVNSLAGDGFRMRSKGAVLGVQSEIKENLTIGIGYATNNSTIKESLRRTEVNANTGFISVQYQTGNWWINGVSTYTRIQYDEEKHVLSSKGIANYNVDSVGAQITAGYNIKLDNWIITPKVGVRYLNARQEGYTDSFGTTVEKTTSNFVTTMAGFKLSIDLGKIKPLAGVIVGYDVITDDITSINTLSNGQTFTINGKALERLSTTVMTGFAADLGNRTTLKLEYSGNYRKKYIDHSGMIRLEYKF